VTSNRVSPSLASRAIKSDRGLEYRRIATRTRSRVSLSHLGICRAAGLFAGVTAVPVPVAVTSVTSAVITAPAGGFPSSIMPAPLLRRCRASTYRRHMNRPKG
jgi:hypothetical protein